MTRRPPTTEICIVLRTILSAGVLAVLLLACAGAAAGATWVVDDGGGADFTSIQAAVDAAGAGDAIEVRSGTYVENVDVNKRLTLIGDGADVVTVRAVDASDHVFEVTADWVDISGFTVAGATDWNMAGFYLHNADHCSISDNTAVNNRCGIYLHSSSENTLTDNTANSNNNYGIALSSSNNNTLTCNTVMGSRYGITMWGSSNNTLTSNTANSNNDYGIVLHFYSSSNNTLTGNTVTNNNHGICLYSSSNNTLTGNTANSNNRYGILLYSSSNNNTVIGNTANLNNAIGIYLWGSNNNNTIYHNNLIDNTNHNAYGSGTNQWDSGSEGNHYEDDYPGTDSDGDGIGDTPYPILGGSSVDRYPLMAPYTPPNSQQDPIADAGADQTVFSGDIVSFVGSDSYDPDGTIVSYQWDFGDGTTAEGEIVSHRFRGTTGLFKSYTVTLIVKDDSAATGQDVAIVKVKQLTKTVEVFDPWAFMDKEPIVNVVAFYNWVDKKDGKDIYIVSKIKFYTPGYVGRYSIDIWKDDAILPIPIWTDSGLVWTETTKLYAPPCTDDGFPKCERYWEENDVIVGPEVNNLDSIQITAVGWAGNHFSFGPSMPAGFYIVESDYFWPNNFEKPDLPSDKLDLTFAYLCSPGELRVYDSQGNVTGLVNGEIKEEIPNSIYNDEIVMIPSSSDSFTYEVKGTDEGSYGLGVATITDKEFINFAATDIPTSANAIHQYKIDWDALSQGGEGVTVYVDANGDGIFEHTIITDNIFRIYNITFLPPITTMEQFNLTDGRTLPIKFTVRNSITNEFIYDDTVNVTITNSTGHLIAFFTNGTGTDSVRINSTEEHYIVNFHTKDYDLNVEETYTIHVTFGEADTLRGYAITHFTLVDRKH